MGIEQLKQVKHPLEANRDKTQAHPWQQLSHCRTQESKGKAAKEDNGSSLHTGHTCAPGSVFLYQNQKE